MREIYLDHAATTRLRPEILEEMMPYLTEQYGNPSAVYRLASRSRAAVDRARDRIGAALHASGSEIYFTSGGTEADNWAITAACEEMLEKRGTAQVITTAIEHHAVLHTCRALERRGVRTVYLKPDSRGVISPEEVEAAIEDDTAVISVMLANNEIGTIEPVGKIGRIVRTHGILMHTDAVQAFGHMDVNVEELCADLLSTSAHKLNGPKGIGCLYVRRGVRLRSFLNGGAQERGKRAGTENVPAIVGFGAAADYAIQHLEENASRTEELRRCFLSELRRQIPEIHVNSTAEHLLPGTVNVTIPGCDAEALLIALDLRGIAASAGSACAAGSLDPSHVLTAIGLSHEEAMCSVRFSLSDENTEEELIYAAQVTAETAGTLCGRK